MDAMFQNTQESGKIDQWNFVNEYPYTNIQGVAYENNGMTSEDQSFATSKRSEAGQTNDDLQNIIFQLRQELEHRNYAIDGLKTKIKHHELKDSKFQKEKNDIINEKNNLLKILCHKNNLIDRMSSDIKVLETQLKSTVSAKFDALIQLNAIEGKEQTLFKEAICDFEGELLSQEVNSSGQKLQYDQDQRQNEITDIHLSSVNYVQQIMDEPIKIHSELNGQKPNDGQITYQSEMPNVMIAQKVKSNGSSKLGSSIQVETVKSYENYENGDLIGSSDYGNHSKSGKQKKNKRASKNLEINLDNVYSEYDCQNIQQDLLSEVRTRGQNQFLRDAFRSVEPSDSETADIPKRSKVHTPNGKRGRRSLPKVDCKSPGSLS